MYLLYIQFLIFTFPSMVQVTQEADVLSAVEVAQKKFHKLDIAVNCAGIGIACKTYNFKKDLPHSLEDFMKVLSVCYFAFK